MAGAIVFHSLEQAIAALTAAEITGRKVTLRSAAGAAAASGPGWFREVVATAATSCPAAQFIAVLDCDDLPGVALGALRAGVSVIALDAPTGVRRRVADMARQQGGRLVKHAALPPLDLLDTKDPLAACLDWLQSQPEGGCK